MLIHGTINKSLRIPGTMIFCNQDRNRVRGFDGLSLWIDAVAPDKAAFHSGRLLQYLQAVPFGIPDTDRGNDSYLKMSREGPHLFVSAELGPINLGYMWLDPWDGKSAQLHMVRSKERAPKEAYLDIAKVFMMECFSLLGIHRLTLMVCADDNSSVRGATALGFKLEGAIREALWFKGKPQSVLIFGVIGGEWKWLRSVRSWWHTGGR